MKHNRLLRLFVLMLSSVAGAGLLAPDVSSEDVSQATSNGAVEFLPFGDGEMIEAAISRVYAAGGGTVKLASGVYTVSSPITMRSGVSLVGEMPKIIHYTTSATSGFISDLNGTISGGTILTNPGGTVIDANDVYGFRIENLGIKDCAIGITLGSPDTFGCQMCEINNVIIDKATSVGFRAYNFQHILSNGLKILNLGGTSASSGAGAYGVHLVADNTSGGSVTLIPGNSEFTGLYIGRTVTSDTQTGIVGLKIEVASTSNFAMNVMTFIRPQVNLFGFTGTKAGSGRYGIQLIGDATGGSVNGVSIIDADIEGANEYGLYCNYTSDTYVSMRHTTTYANFVSTVMVSNSLYDSFVGCSTCTYHFTTSVQNTILTGVIRDFATVNSTASYHPIGTWRTTVENKLTEALNKETDRYRKTTSDGYFTQLNSTTIGHECVGSRAWTPWTLSPAYGDMILCDNGSSAQTVNLPNPATYPGYTPTIKQVGTGTLTIGYNGYNIDETAADITVTTQYESYTFTNDGTSWYIVAHYVP